MKLLSIIAFTSFLSGSLFGQETLRVSNEIAPPGGVAQVKVMLTIPQPVSGGRFCFAFAGDAIGLAIFDPAGQTAGIAIRDTDLAVIFTSASKMVGTLPDYPILTIAVRIPTTAAIGSTYPINLDSLDTQLTDFFGNPVPLELKGGSVTVGGTLNVSDVQPGSGFHPAGTVVRIFGRGFTPATKVRLKDGPLSIPTFVSATEMDLMLNQDAQMDGAWVEARNDQERVNYFSYLRGKPDGKTKLLGNVEAIFPSSQITQPTVISGTSTPNLYGLAFQNPNDKPAVITIEQTLTSGGKAPVVSKLTLAPGANTIRALSEMLQPSLAGAPDVAWRVTSSVPVQALGVLTDSGQGSMVPFVINRSGLP